LATIARAPSSPPSRASSVPRLLGISVDFFLEGITISTVFDGNKKDLGQKIKPIFHFSAMDFFAIDPLGGLAREANSFVGARPALPVKRSVLKMPRL
jgi:hypothetical protein